MFQVLSVPQFWPGKHSFSKDSRIYYCKNFNPELQQIIRSGDIHPQPGCETRMKCLTCSRTITWNHWSTTCTTCKSRFHIKCSGLSVTNIIINKFTLEISGTGIAQIVSQSKEFLISTTLSMQRKMTVKLKMQMSKMCVAWKIIMQTCTVQI